jgi:succinate-semialdehyde dehydrogenase/glutarate-semialdehyde dehydrogenase
MGKLLIDGEWVDGISSQQLTERFSGAIYDEMAVASATQVEAAVTGLVAAQLASKVAPYERFKILSNAAHLLEGRKERLMDLMRAEAGFTRADSENEIRRTVQTLELSAEEAKRLVGDMVPMEAAQGVKNRVGFTIRSPRGVVCAITPFNSPLNTLAHKVGPALAGGNAVVIKPSEYTPLTAVELCQVLIDAGLPAKMLALVHGDGGVVGPQLLADQRIAFYAFTGSTRVGREIQRAAGLRATQLELGSIASTIVCHDAQVEIAIAKIVNAGFRKAGQVCTSVQRLFVDRRVATEFIPQFIAATRSLKCGDPADPATVIGPMITVQHAQRAASWIAEAVAGGAQILTGGRCEGALLEPTVLTRVSDTMRVVCQEIFAPVVSIIEFDQLDEAITRANAQPFGLSVGLFTSNLHVAFSAARALRFGGIHINEASSARVDVMPFGGVKDSGYGREGPAYAIREMTEERLVTIAY